MTPELEYITKYAPSIGVLVAVVLLIAYVKKALFQDVVSKEHFQAQMDREREFVSSTKEAASHLEEIRRQLENVTKKQSEDVHQQTDAIREVLEDVKERLRTLELVFSDNIDAIRHLAAQCEKHRKNIPDTQNFSFPSQPTR
jgi:hypothetical protein